MNKKRQGKRRILAWMLCMTLITVNIVPSARNQVAASETVMGQEDFFEAETYTGGVF